METLEYKKKLNEVAEIPEAIKLFFTEDEEGRHAKSEYKVSQPLIRVGIYALSQESSFISEVMDHLDCLNNENVLSPYYTGRLEPKELFCCLRLLESECLWRVLERIKGHSIAVLENLKYAILKNDIEVFRSIIYEKEVNTDPITPVCKLLYLKIRIDDLNKWIEESFQQFKSLSDAELDEYRDKIREFLLQYTSKYHVITNDLVIYKERIPFIDISFENAERTLLNDDFDVTNPPPSVRDLVVHNLKKTYPTFIENGFSLNEYTDNIYKGVLLAYYMMKNDLRSLSTVAKVVMEGILKAEEFRSIWSRFEDFEDFDDSTIDVLEKEHDDFLLKHGIPIDEDSHAEEKSPVLPQIEEPASVESQPEQLSAADYNQVIPDALTTEHLDLIKEFEIGKKYFARKKRDYEQPHCMLLNEGFNVMADEDKANRFERLMKLLAKTRCIYPSFIVMRSCAYAMTGYGFNNPFKPVPVFWNREREKVNILLYICQKFYNKRGNAKTPMSKFKNPAEVFHVINEYQEASNRSQSASKVDTGDFGKDFKAIFPEL